MKRKLPWMKLGAKVLAFGRRGAITKIETSKIDGVDYVNYIYVKIVGGKFSNPYHPADVTEAKANEVQAA